MNVKLWLGFCLLSMLLAQPVRAPAATAMTFAAPAEVWLGRRPSPNCPTTCSTGGGVYAEFELGVAALRSYAATHAPDGSARVYSPMLAPIPFAAGEYDTDGDGRDDRFGFAHPFADDFPARRSCTAFRDGTLTPSWNGALSSLAVGLSEPEPAPLTAALAATAYTKGITRCALGDFRPRIQRTVLPLFSLQRATGYACPRGFALDTLLRPGRGCRHLGGAVPERNLGPQCPALANGSNPINAVTGNKYQFERDYAGTARGWLAFARHYNSQSTDAGVLGGRWRHSYERSVRVTCVSFQSARACAARAARDDGRVLSFVQEAQTWRADATVTERLRTTADGGLELRTRDGRRETYARHGQEVGESIRYRLTTVADASGAGERLHYAPNGRLERVTDVAGRALEFVYDGRGQLAGLRDPSGARYDYTYDVMGRLAHVIYPDADDDASPVSRDDNPARNYRYEHAADPGALTGIVDENGARYATWDYDAVGRAIASEHADGVGRISFEYASGYTAVTDAHGVTRSFNTTLVGGVGLVSAVSGPPCNYCGPAYHGAVSHDARGFAELVTDPAGNMTTFEHDGAGFELHRVEAYGTTDSRSTSTRWDAATDAPAEIERRDAAGRAVWRQENTYRNGRLATRTEFDLRAPETAPRRWTFAYFGDDPGQAAEPLRGLLRSVDGPRDDVDDSTHYAYDEHGNLVAVVNALGQQTRFTRHDAHGRALEWVDPNGVVTSVRYHPRGWLLAHAVAGAETRFDYDRVGQLTRVELPDGSALAYRYDAARRLVAVSDRAGNELRFDHDALGNRTHERVFDAQGELHGEVRRHYDAFNRLAETVSASGSRVFETHDHAGNLLARSRPTQGGTADLASTTFVHDALARVRELRDAMGGVVAVEFGSENMPRRVVTANGVETRYDYNGHGELTAVASADVGRSEYAYDAAGNRTRETTASGAVIGYAYDALNRLVLIDYASGVDVHYEYDDPLVLHGRGRLTRLSDESGVTTYAYDARGNVIEKVVHAAGERSSTAYTYDAADRLLAVVYPSGRRVDYQRGADGAVLAVNSTAAGAAPEVVLADIRYAPFGPPRAWRHGNGVVMTRSFDRDYRPATLGYSGVLTRSYAHDAAGNITAITRTDRPIASESYRYDALDRLLHADGPWGEHEYSYDANGNRLTTRSGSVSERYRYRAGTNQLAVIDPRPAAAATAVSHDRAGRIVADGSGARYVYGDDGRLDLLTQPRLRRSSRFTHVAGGAVASDRLEQDDVTGRRVSERRYHYDEAQRVLALTETQAADGTRRLLEFIYLDELLVAWQSEHGLEHVHTDHLGTPLAASDAAGRTVAEMSPPPFSGIGDGTPAFAPGYPGQYAVLGTAELRHNGAREYGLRVGRYLSSDPLGLAGGLNPYAYAENNPLAQIDPAGTCPWCAAYAAGVVGRAVAGAALGAAFNLAEQLFENDGEWTCIEWQEVGLSAAASALLAGGLGAYTGRPFWQYFPADNPAYASRWITRASGWRPPYSSGREAVERLALPNYNPATGVRAVVPQFWRPVVGPRQVQAAHGQPGGGVEYMQGLRW